MEKLSDGTLISTKAEEVASVLGITDPTKIAILKIAFKTIHTDGKCCNRKNK